MFSLLCVLYRRALFLLTFMDWNFVCNPYIEIFRFLGCYAACIVLKMRLFREWEVVERVELKIDGMYQVQDSLHYRKYILYFHGKYIKKSRRLTVRTTTDLFLLALQSGVLYARSVFSVTLHLAERTLLIPAEESIQIATAPCLVLFQLRSLGIFCCVWRTTRRHAKRP